MAAFNDAAGQMEDLALAGTKQRGGGGHKGRGGRHGGGGGGGREMMISKGLSTLLRHQAQNAGVKLDDEGFARLDHAIAWPRVRSLNPTVAEVQAVVAADSKQRFTLKRVQEFEDDDAEENIASTWLIRANQGHTIKLENEGLHTPITLGSEDGTVSRNIPEVIVHGTYFIFWNSIVEAGGLKKMSRQHVHFGTGLPEDGKKDTQQAHDVADEEAAAAEAPQKPKAISGMRSDAELLIFVDVEQSLKDGGMEWWLSSNGVVLTEGDKDGVVPLKYFKEVRGRRQGVGELWKNGEKVQDMPDAVVMKMPHGKGPKQPKGEGGGGRRGRGGRRGGKQ